MSKDTVSTPAGRIIERFGAKQVAVWTGRHVSRVHAWAWPASKGGTGGVVPVRLRDKIIAGAHQQGHIDVGPADFDLKPGETYLFEGAA